VPLAERQRFQASNLARRVRLPQGTLKNRVGSSAAERLPVKRQRVGSSPTRPSHIAGCLLVDRRGFEPRRRGFDSCTRNFDDDTNRTPMRDRSMAGRGALNAEMLVRVQLPQLRHCRLVRATARMSDPASKTTTEVNRPDEEPVLKTGAGSRSLWVQVPRLPPSEEQHGPVAQRRGQLPYKETIGGSSPPRITDAAR
jgi:hypothetical protein